MKTIVLALVLALIALTGVPVIAPETAPAYAQSKDELRAKCKKMLRKSYGLESGQQRRGKTGGGASVYYSQIEACAANGGRL